jgi:hypothetical protein
MTVRDYINTEYLMTMFKHKVRNFDLKSFFTPHKYLPPSRYLAGSENAGAAAGEVPASAAAGEDNASVGADKNVIQGRRTFRRGLPSTVIGLLHMIFGFTGLAWAAARIIIIGYSGAFEFGRLLGLYNYAFELKEALLWLSGIGILRSRRWGYMLASVWAGLTVFFHLSAHLIRESWWGGLAPEPEWGDVLIIYYSIIFIFFAYGIGMFKKLYGNIKNRITDGG